MRTRPSLVAICMALIISLTAIVAVSPSTHADSASIFRDDFGGEVLGSDWEVALGNAWMDDGWVVLEHLRDGVGPRNAAIVANEGGDWSDYRISTRFIADGGGEDWYRADVLFRVANYHDFPPKGSYYVLIVKTPIYVYGLGPEVTLVKQKNDVVSILDVVVPPLGVIDNFDNTIDIEADGGHFQVWVNGWLAIDVVDPDPVATGGVGLEATWESRTRFDSST